MIKRIVLAHHRFPPVMDYLGKAFEKRGVTVMKFVMETNHWFDRFFIHNIDKQLWNLKLLPKGKSAFEGHPLSHLHYRSSQLEKLVDAFNPELFLLIRGWRITEQTLQRIREKSVSMGWWIETEKKFKDSFREIALYDHFFVMNSNCHDEAVKHGFDNTSVLYQAVDPASFYPIENSPEVFDCCFVGGWSERRQAFIEKALETTENIAIYGSKWKKKNASNPKLLKAVKGDFIDGHDLIRLYNESRVVLNITNWAKDEGRWGGMTLRVFEVPACRSFLLTDCSSDVENVLTPGRHIAVFREAEDFGHKLAYYLQNEKERKAIAQEGHLHVTSNCTYDNVAERILQTHEELKSKTAG